MRTIRRWNWFIKRFALGLAVAAVAAPVAQAQVDEGSSVQASPPQILKGPHHAMPSIASRKIILRRDGVEVVRARPLSKETDIVAADYGMPRALPSDYAQLRGDQIEVIRSVPRWTSSDKIEFVRSTQPRSTSPALANRFGVPNATTSTQVSAVDINWGDAAIGAGFVLGLVLLGGGAALATRHMGREQTA